jgi:hypothetical protein
MGFKSDRETKASGRENESEKVKKKKKIIHAFRKSDGPK